MSTEPIAINRYLGTKGVDELNEVIASAYNAIGVLRGAAIPDGFTAWDFADAILDTFNGHASSGFNVNASDLVDFVCTAVEGLAGRSPEASKEPAGFVIVDIKTREIDWDCELHPTREAAFESLTGPCQSYCRTPEEETEERTYWGKHYEILAVMK